MLSKWPGRVFPLDASASIPVLVLSYPELMSLWKNEWIDEWMGMKEMEKWMNGGTNEWTSSEQKIYIYYGWILSEWVDECPKIADGANELVNIMQFILVTMHMITPSRYMCTYVCLHPTGYVEYTMQIILQGYAKTAFWGHLAHWNQECPQLFWLQGPMSPQIWDSWMAT